MKLCKVSSLKYNCCFQEAKKRMRAGEIPEKEFYTFARKKIVGFFSPSL